MRKLPPFHAPLMGAVFLGGVALAACHPVQGHYHHHGAYWEGDNHWNWDRRKDDAPVTVAATRART